MTGFERERGWWIASLSLVVLIYATLYFVRAPVEFLRERGLLRLTIGLLFGGAGAAVVRYLWLRGVGIREGLVAVVFGAAFATVVLLAELPEEKLHFLEYGVLGGLLFEACRLRAVRLGRSVTAAALTATVLAGLAGWGDEGVQALLPNRYYDPRDILWNFLGSTIVILALAVAGAARKRDAEG